MLRNIINTLFGTDRKTEVHQKPIISEADSVKDSISETPIPQLSVDLGDPEVKIKLLGSIFPEKFYFDEKNIEPPSLIICSVLSSTKPSTYKDRKKWNLQKNLKIPLG